jgi:hypothetical protein
MAKSARELFEEAMRLDPKERAALMRLLVDGLDAESEEGAEETWRVAVAASPRTWPRLGSRARRYVFPRYPFSLVDILRGEAIEVVAVAHGRRRPGYWRSRLGRAL